MITEEQITMAAEEIHGQLGGAVAFSRLTDTQRAELCDAARAVAAFGFEPYTDAHTGELLFRRKSSEPAPAASVPDELPPRAPMQHELKTWPPFFGDVRSGMKSFDVRPADRDYRVCDTLRLREWDPANGDYSGEEHVATVTYVLTGGVFGVERGYVVLGLSAAMAAAPQVEPVLLLCPRCGVQHVDSGEWATRPHHTHQCQACGAEWRVPDYVRGVRMYNADALAAAPQRVREVGAKQAIAVLVRDAEKDARIFERRAEGYGESIKALNVHLGRIGMACCDALGVPAAEGPVEPLVQRVIDQLAAATAERDGLRAEVEALREHARFFEKRHDAACRVLEIGESQDLAGEVSRVVRDLAAATKRAEEAERERDALAAGQRMEQKIGLVFCPLNGAHFGVDDKGPWKHAPDDNKTRIPTTAIDVIQLAHVELRLEVQRRREAERKGDAKRAHDFDPPPTTVDPGARAALLKLIGLLSERDPRAQEVAGEMHAALKGGA